MLWTRPTILTHYLRALLHRQLQITQPTGASFLKGHRASSSSSLDIRLHLKRTQGAEALTTPAHMAPRACLLRLSPGSLPVRSMPTTSGQNQVSRQAGTQDKTIYLEMQDLSDKTWSVSNHNVLNRRHLQRRTLPLRVTCSSQSRGLRPQNRHNPSSVLN